MSSEETIALAAACISFGTLLVSIWMLHIARRELKSSSDAAQAILISKILEGMDRTKIYGEIRNRDADAESEGEGSEPDDTETEILLNQLELYATFVNNKLMKNKQLADFMNKDFPGFISSY